MDKITKKVLVKIIIKYYLNEKGYTQMRIAEKLGVDHSSVSNWLHMRTGDISTPKFTKILNFLSKDINKDINNDFTNYVLLSLCDLGYDKSKCKSILDKYSNISTRLEELLSQYDTIVPKLQHNLNISSIIYKLRSILRSYEDYIKINNQQIAEDSSAFSYSHWLSYSKDSQDPSLVTQQNYLILNFPSNYRVAIVLSNYIFDDILRFGESVRQLKEKNSIHLIIVFTDDEVSFSHQKYLMETYNLFFETITKQDLMHTSLQNVSINDIMSGNVMDAQFYAQVVFERITAYFAVIRNEIIFRTYDCTRIRPLVKTPIDKNDLFKGFAGKILLDEIFKFSYLSRHTIYFERKRLTECVKDYVNKYKRNIETAIEICYPNSFLSSSIYEKCNKLLLFTSSYSSLDVMKKINDENENPLFPANMEFHLSHIHPQYISNQYYNSIIGKVDLVILGFGMGSSLINITEYMRHINSWLSPTGMIFISFANTDSIILHKQFNIRNYLETTPLYFSDYWQYTANENLKFLARVKRYNIEEAKRLISTYVDECTCYTYPFLSALANITQSDNWLVDEIREIDKEYALKGNSRHGHYITVIGNKNNVAYSANEHRDLQIHKLIMSFLDESKIEYELIPHSITIDTQNLFRTLVEKGEDINQFDLIRTVILQNHEGTYKYVILPRVNKISFNSSKTSLLSEKTITQIYGIGSVSPLVICPSVIKLTQIEGNYFLSGMTELTKKFVIISSGSSTESLKIKRSDFINLMISLGCIITESEKILDEKTIV